MSGAEGMPDVTPHFPEPLADALSRVVAAVLVLIVLTGLSQRLAKGGKGRTEPDEVL